ncbi:MAG: lysoplasmalogenase [Bacteroidaceae bacterium]|nr:lysoplasmalogenase [Bacteroidaceae bacterium]
MRRRRICEVLFVLAFLLTAVWFFFPGWKPEGVLFAMRLALPAVVLAVGSLLLRAKLMMVGFWFCALGDAMGVLGSFEGQMGGFALAHIYFICFFWGEVSRAKVHPFPIVTLAVASLVCLVPLGFAAWKVIPAIPELPIRIGCSIYALLLTGTLWTAIMRDFSDPFDRASSPIKASYGAVAFLTSDFILAWNKFVEHIPHASYYIMFTYYCALLLLFAGTKSNEKR